MKNFSQLRVVLMLGAAVFVGACPSLAIAQQDEESAANAGRSSQSQTTGLEEIVVTARRREENLQTTPVSITAVTTATLEQRNITSIDKIARLAPGLTVAEISGGIATAGPYIRGIGYADYIPGQDSPVAIYVDGVVSGRNGVALMQMVQPDRVEVLRGPQGTLFGRNTSGGAILVTSHTPTDDFSGMAKVSYATFAAITAQARIDTGLLGDTGVKVSAGYNHFQRNGPFDAPARPRDLDPGAQKSDSYWLKMVAEWGDFTASLSGDYSKLRGTPMPLQIFSGTPAFLNFIDRSSTVYGGAPYEITSRRLRRISEAFAGVQTLKARGVALNMAWQVSDQLTLKSITGFRGFTMDNPWALGPNELRGNVGTVAVPVIRDLPGSFALENRAQRQSQFSQEGQVLGNFGDFNFVVGAYYFKETAHDQGTTRLPSVSAANGGLTAVDFQSTRVYSVGSKSFAGFGQVNWRPGFLDEKLELSGGIRWTRDRRDFDQTVAIVRSADLVSKDTSYQLSANYQWAQGAMTYVRYTTGYRAGGFNARAGLTDDPVYRPEKIKTLEAGFKLDLFDNHFRFNGAGFMSTYRDLQVGFFVPPGVGVGGGDIAVNANAKYKGFELEAQAIPVPGLTLTGALSYVHRRFTSYPKALEAGGLLLAGCTPILSDTNVAIGQDCKDVARFNYAPKWTADISLGYEFPATSFGKFSVFASYSYKSQVEFVVVKTAISPNQDLVKAPGYGLVSGRIALSDIPLSGDLRGQISIFGDNLTDKDYITLGSDLTSYAARQWGIGRTVGVEFKVDF